MVAMELSASMEDPDQNPVNAALLPAVVREGPRGRPPVSPETYDYRRAALDAFHFLELIDRLWQNLRRAVGFKVQYFSAVEPRRRLAPHLHAAVRGAIPRALFREVTEATYHQVWWPSCDPVYVRELPVWVGTVGYADPTTGEALPTWTEALDTLESEDARPVHVLRFGRQVDLQGIVATEGDADRRVGYLRSTSPRASPTPSPTRTRPLAVNARI